MCTCIRSHSGAGSGIVAELGTGGGCPPCSLPGRKDPLLQTSMGTWKKMFPHQTQFAGDTFGPASSLCLSLCPLYNQEPRNMKRAHLGGGAEIRHKKSEHPTRGSRTRRCVATHLSWSSASRGCVLSNSTTGRIGMTS